MDAAGVGYGATAGKLSQMPPPPQAVNPSCFGNIEDACSTCSSVAQRVERTVAKLAGDYPSEDTGKGAVQSSPNGLLDAADRQAHDIRESMRRILRALDILDKTLP